MTCSECNKPVEGARFTLTIDYPSLPKFRMDNAYFCSWSCVYDFSRQIAGRAA